MIDATFLSYGHEVLALLLQPYPTAADFAKSYRAADAMLSEEHFYGRPLLSTRATRGYGDDFAISSRGSATRPRPR